MTVSKLKLIAACTLVSALAACSGASQSDYDNYPGSAPGNERILGRSATRADMKKQGGVFGDEGLNIFGSDSKKQQGGTGIGVNSFLWRATLDTLSFMPLNSADPFGGVIITDWYSPAETPNERFKITGYILGVALRSDAVKVAIFRQVRAGGNEWADAVVDPKTVTAMEDSILTRARQLRIDSASNQ
ncbi:DUF3576 domain-containing protein [Thalassospira sp. NFXS8]|uniref:DUF3576 domain-containing protein n=1 Tax=Thalassospira sp. NFXS8 TaxID=2819093 RepID=UPI0032DF9514